MKLSIRMSASATFMLAAAGVAATDAPQSLAEALKNFEHGGGIEYLAGDGVLRSINSAYDTVVDYVQLSELQIEEYMEKLGKPGIKAGVDGRHVTSEAQLWAVPAEIHALSLKETKTETKTARELFANEKRAECRQVYECRNEEYCYQWNCSRCIADPPFGCGLNCITQRFCAFDRN
ncbi:hypothetical protein DE146DRAFT_662538 [Phaeosphaeria sp. MPI-PUGE-AT-0046c]|nr:hypothetical protein DE146DRAFT_662538 [Phaeosphaeria sp. MPI-PUGE-AT-0046c]